MKAFFKAHIFHWLILLSLLPFSAFGQDTKTNENPVLKKKDETKDEIVIGNEVVTLRHNSKLMSREMPYRVIFPFSYKNRKESGKRYAVVYLLHGLSGHFDNWTDKTKLALYAKNYDYIIIMPEGGDGWYTDSATVPADKYESYVIEELIPEVDKKFRTIADREHRVIAGLSMGGYGAIKFGLKYSDKFALVGSFSGALDAATRGQNHPYLRPSIISVFGAEDSQTRKDNDIFRLVKDLPGEKIKDLPFIYADCGTEDGFFQINRDFADLLRERKIPHEFRELPGKHDWNFWNAQVREFLELAEKRVK